MCMSYIDRERSYSDGCFVLSVPFGRYRVLSYIQDVTVSFKGLRNLRLRQTDQASGGRRGLELTGKAGTCMAPWS